MRKEGLSGRETEREFNLPHNRASIWERIYVEEGPEGLAVKRRGRANAGRPRKLPKKVEEDLLAIAQLPQSELLCLQEFEPMEHVETERIE